jgi:hypothetical protein
VTKYEKSKDEDLTDPLQKKESRVISGGSHFCRNPSFAETVLAQPQIFTAKDAKDGEETKNHSPGWGKSSRPAVILLKESASAATGYIH